MKLILMGLVALLVITGAGRAQDCIDYRTALIPQTGFATLTCSLDAIDASDAHLCYARTDETGSQCVVVWCDINADGTPNALGQLALAGTKVTVLRVSGSRVAARHVDGAWQVVEFADPANPELVGSMGPEHPCADLDLDGNLVFAADSTGIAIYELTDGGPPQQRSLFATPPSAYPPRGTSSFLSLDVEDGRCWALLEDSFESDHFPWLVVLDVSDPLAPTLSHSRAMAPCYWESCSFAATIRADGARAVLSEVQMGYTAIYQLADAPNIDVGMELAESRGGVNKWRVAGDWAYRNDTRRLTYFHVEDGVWREAGSWSSTGAILAASAAGVWVGTTCFQAGITSYRPQPPAPPRPGVTAYDPQERAGNMISAGGRLLLSEWTWGSDSGPTYNWISVLEAADPPMLTKTHELAFTPCRNCLAFAANDSFVYTNSGVWDSATGAQINTGTYDVLATIGPTLWCRGTSGLDVYDLADPAAPRPVGNCFSPLRPLGAAAFGSRAVLAVTDQLLVVDASDPLAPVELSRTAHAQNRIYSLGLSADAVYVSYGSDIPSRTGFDVYRIHDDGSLSEAPTFSLTGLHVADLVLDGSLMYTVSGEGLRIFDLADPAVPVEIGTYLDQSWLSTVALLGDYVYTNDLVEISTLGPGHVRAFPRQCPVSVPVALRELSVRWLDSAVHLSWTMDMDLAAVRVLARAGARERVLPWQVRSGHWEAVDEDAPFGQTVSYQIQAMIGGQWSTLAERSLVVPAAVLALEDPVPNPFNPATELRYTLDESGIMELAIFDAAGRRLCTLASGRQDAGPHAVTWRGLDDTGKPMPAGMYLARLTTPHGSRSAKLTLLQ